MGEGSAIVKKYERALEGIQASENYFNELSATNSPENIALWTAQIEEAQQKRFTDRSAMDIFDVTLASRESIKSISSSAEQYLILH